MKNTIKLMREKKIPNLVCDSDVKFLLKSETLKNLEEIMKDIEKNANKNDSISFFNEHLDLIDKEKFCLYNAYLIKKLLGEDSREFQSAIKMISPNCRKSIMFWNLNDINDGISRNKTVFITYNLLKGKTKTNKKDNYYKYLDEKYKVSQVLGTIVLDDIGLCLRSDIVDDEWSKYCISNNLKNRILYNSILRKSGMTNKELQTCMVEDEKKFMKLGKKYLNSDVGIDEIKKVITEYSDFIDFDKLLLLFAYRQIEYIQCRDGSEDAIEEAKQNLLNIKKYFDEESKKKKKYNIHINNAVSRNDNDKFESITYSYAQLVKDIDKFVGKEFIGNEKRIEYINRINNGELRISDLSEELIKALDFSKEELMQFSTLNDENYLYYLSKLDYKHILNEIENKDEISGDVLKYLFTTRIITTEEIINLYMKEKISLESIMKIKDESNLEDVISNQKLYELYEKSKENVGKKDCIETEKEFNRYALLYKNVRLIGKSTEEQEKVMSEFVEDIILNTDIDFPKGSSKEEKEEIEAQFQRNVLKDFYKKGIISLDIATDWIGETFANEMFEENILKPIDIKRLYKKKIITDDLIKKVLNSEMTTAEKMDLIFSVFDGDSEDEYKKRLELIQYLHFGKGLKNSSYCNQRKRKSKDSDSDTKKYISDPNARWKLISLLDRDYTKEVSHDSYAIFHLPNVNNGQVIIEKMFEIKKGALVPSYGTATYILSEEEFIKNKLLVDKDGLQVVDRKKLLELAKLGKAQKIVHSPNWGNSIKQYFGVERPGSRYTAVEIAKINQTIRNIEKSRKLIK